MIRETHVSKLLLVISLREESREESILDVRDSEKLAKSADQRR